MSKGVILSVAVMAVIAINKSFAQTTVKTDKVKTKKTLVLYVGGGLANYLAPIKIQPVNLQNNITRTSATGTIRIMWHPGYRLNLGIESGYSNFYSYYVKNNGVSGKLSLHAVPLLLVWSMPIIKRVNIFYGLGSYLLTTYLKYDGVVKSKTFSLGSNIALSYTHPLSKKLGIAAEAKWMNAFVTKDNLLSLEVQMVWKFLEF